MHRQHRGAYFKTVRAKLSLASIVCILVPALLTMLIYNALTKDAVEQQARSNSVDAMQLVSESVNNLLQGMLNLTNYIQVNTDMSGSLKRIVDGSASNADPYNQFTDTSRIMQQLVVLPILARRAILQSFLRTARHSRIIRRMNSIR
jgi:two-component system, sensor histidine kinase YesM